MPLMVCALTRKLLSKPKSKVPATVPLQVALVRKLLSYAYCTASPLGAVADNR
jgi:hypothetical protein